MGEREGPKFLRYNYLPLAAESSFPFISARRAIFFLNLFNGFDIVFVFALFILYLFAFIVTVISVNGIARCPVSVSCRLFLLPHTVIGVLRVDITSPVIQTFAYKKKKKMLVWLEMAAFIELVRGPFVLVKGEARFSSV